MSQPHPREREHYRVTCPTPARPRFIVDGLARDVVDLCQMGLRCRAVDGERRELGDEVRGTVRVRRGEAVEIFGTAASLVGREIAPHLSRGIPLRMVIDEQRHLREHHRGSAW